MKIDYNRNRYVAEQLVKAFPGRIIAASATTDENYDVDDIWFTSATVFDILVPHKLENKTIKILMYFLLTLLVSSIILFLVKQLQKRSKKNT